MGADVSRLRRGVEEWVADVGERAAADMLKDAEGAAPFRTGKLVREGVVRRRVRSGARHLFELAFPTDYASYTNDGTPPHVIRPRKASVLRFYWPRVGRVVYFQKVNHPGTKPTRWFDRTVTQSRWAALVARHARVPRRIT